MVPQTQVEGSARGLQPYRKQRASRNAPLWRWNPCSLIGTTVNQAEAPLLLAISNNLYKGLVRLSRTAADCSLACWRWVAWIEALISDCKLLTCDGIRSDWEIIRSTRGPVTAREEVK